MFSKILVANRGEIAVRIIRACQEMGIATVAIYSEVDDGAPHVQMADEAHPLGDPAPSESYLNIEKILGIAEKSGAEAIHPGYGFLSENAEFARRCEESGIVFIGPPAEVIAKMGDKVAAKKTMESAQVPTVPGFYGSAPEEIAEWCEGIGYPVLVKAAGGGGGKGMRIVHSPSQLPDALISAQREAKSAFGDERVFVEKFLRDTRHIEFQVLADKDGKTIHLFERECSIQRRHQKVIEETPSVALTPEMRSAMGEAAVRAARAAGYVNAGTVEFMFSEGRFYFLEMNTRLQVEHAITEATTGTDIVKWQIRIAADEPLTLEQRDIVQRGHAIECRIYAEDPEHGFMPSTGKVHRLDPPSGVNVRLDSGVDSGQVITPYYDPLLAKLIVYAESRDDALQKMDWALSNYVALGITTNIPFLRAVVRHPAFRRGETTTRFIEEHMGGWRGAVEPPSEALIAAAIFNLISTQEGTEAKTEEHTPWKVLTGWRMGE
ncbi:MAG: acetyl-CoA carboxylase biotin carboxylase subunit [Candidatus Thermoplasmatota archaeon]